MCVYRTYIAGRNQADCYKPLGLYDLWEARLAHKDSGTFVPNGNTPIQDPAYQRAKDSLVSQSGFGKIFGDNYESDSRFKSAVDAVMRGRSPWLVLADFTDEASDYRVPKDDGRGWAW